MYCNYVLRYIYIYIYILNLYIYICVCTIHSISISIYIMYIYIYIYILYIYIDYTPMLKLHAKSQALNNSAGLEPLEPLEPPGGPTGPSNDPAATTSPVGSGSRCVFNGKKPSRNRIGIFWRYWSSVGFLYWKSFPSYPRMEWDCDRFNWKSLFFYRGFMDFQWPSLIFAD